MRFPEYLSKQPPAADEKEQGAADKTARRAGKVVDQMLSRKGRVLCGRLVGEAEAKMKANLDLPEKAWPAMLSRLGLFSDADWAKLRRQGRSFLAVKAAPKSPPKKAAKAD